MKKFFRHEKKAGIKFVLIICCENLETICIYISDVNRGLHKLTAAYDISSSLFWLHSRYSSRCGKFVWSASCWWSFVFLFLEAKKKFFYGKLIILFFYNILFIPEKLASQNEIFLIVNNSVLICDQRSVVVYWCVRTDTNSSDLL